MKPDNKILELKEAALAYRVACEYDYCPGSEEHKSVTKEICKIKKSTLDRWQGLRPDEIVGSICNLIKEL